MATTLLGLGILVLAACVLGWLLRRSAVPAGALIGGVLAGTLLGPSVLGRVAPETFAHWNSGTSEAQVELDTLRAIQYEAILNPAIPSPPAEQLAELHRQVQQAQWLHQQPIRIVVVLCIALLLLAVLAAPRGVPDPRHGWAAPVSIGMWAALIPGGLLLIILHTLLGYSLDLALLAGVAIAIGPWAMTADDRKAADDAEFGGAFLMHLAGRVATIIALIALFATLYRAHADAARLVWFAPLALLPLSWLLPPRDRPAVLDAARHWLLPIIGGLIMLRVDVLESITFWAMLLAIILSGDGRWMGAFLGAMAPGGRRPMRTMRLVVGAMAAGPTQLAILAPAAWTDTLPADLLLALLLGAVVVEITTPLRRMTVERIRETEMEFEAIMRDDAGDEK